MGREELAKLDETFRQHFKPRAVLRLLCNIVQENLGMGRVILYPLFHQQDVGTIQFEVPECFFLSVRGSGCHAREAELQPPKIFYETSCFEVH